MLKRELKDRLRAKYPTVYGKATGWSIGDGWYGIADQLGSELTQLRPIVAIEKIQEKHGFLDIDYGKASDEAEALLDAASYASETICELCGQPGCIDPRDSWLKTRCTNCRAMDRPAAGGVH